MLLVKAMAVHEKKRTISQLKLIISVPHTFKILGFYFIA